MKSQFRNPTTLQLGMQGTLLGKTYRVAGRVVLSMDDAGQTYYWNEFNLLSDSGDSATLVYEETDHGGQWRLFTYFEPQFPITAEDAHTKRVGDPINLDGTDVRVTLVDQSLVCHIEGQPPEGVELGDVAHYFNAEAPNLMLVVSWTGHEVECYHGEDLSTHVVASAFNLPRPTVTALTALPATRTPLVWLVSVIAACAIGFVAWSLARSRPVTTTKPVAAPKSRLLVGTTGTLDGQHFKILSHALVQVAQVGQSAQHHEYILLRDDEEKALLVYGFTPGKADWLLFSPAPVPDTLTPQSAAALQAGRSVVIGSHKAVVRNLFHSTTLTAEPASFAAETRRNISYGLYAQAGPTLFLLRWNQTHLAAYRGRTIDKNQVSAAFGAN